MTHGIVDLRAEETAVRVNIAQRGIRVAVISVVPGDVMMNRCCASGGVPAEGQHPVGDNIRDYNNHGRRLGVGTCVCAGARKTEIQRRASYLEARTLRGVVAGAATEGGGTQEAQPLKTRVIHARWGSCHRQRSMWLHDRGTLRADGAAEKGGSGKSRCSIWGPSRRIGCGEARVGSWGR